MRTCFLSEANYSNYAKRVKDFNIKKYLELELDIPFYISTNVIGEFKEYENHPLIRVFDINELRKNNLDSLRNEPLPDDPTGLYPSRYPWNLRRFILRKAAEDGYTALHFLECDTRIKNNLTKEQIEEILPTLYSPNTVKSSSARFVYKHRHPSQELFYYHSNYIEDLGFSFSDDEYDTLDGTNQLYFGENAESLLKFFNNWDFICNYGYEKPYGYKTGYLSNLSFVIPMSNYKLIHIDTPFETHHVFEDRY